MGDSTPPIISQEELHASRYLRPEHRGCGLLKISEGIVIKYGEYISMSEAETMHLLSFKAPTVPIPRLRNAYSIAGVGYIAMDYIEGRTLFECWSTMTEEEQKRVVYQLRQHISEWRRIEGDYFGSVDKGPCKERLFSHVYDDSNKTYGPFPTRQEYNRG